jgi:hypothetical protein
VTKQTFAKVAFKHNATGAILQGEFVVESSVAWQVAVDGKVRLVMKNEWTSIAVPSSGGFEDIFGSPFGGGLFGGKP